MSFIDDLNKAVGMFDKQVQTYKTTQAFDLATNKMKELQESKINEIEKRRAMDENARMLSMELGRIGAPVAQQQIAKMNFAAPALPSFSQQIQEGIAFNDPKSVEKGQKGQVAEGLVDFNRKLMLLKAAQKAEKEVDTRPKVKGLIEDPGVQITDDDVKKAKEAKKLGMNLLQDAIKLRDLYKSKGFATFGREYGEAESLVSNMRLKYKESDLINLGVLNGPDLEILTGIIPDITRGPIRRTLGAIGFNQSKSAEIEGKLDVLVKAVNRNMKSAVETHGFVFDPRDPEYNLVYQAEVPEAVMQEINKTLPKVRGLGPNAEAQIKWAVKNYKNPQARSLLEQLSPELLNVVEKSEMD